MGGDFVVDCTTSTMTTTNTWTSTPNLIHPPHGHIPQDLLYLLVRFNVLEDEEQSRTTIHLPVTSWEVCVYMCVS